MNFTNLAVDTALAFTCLLFIIFLIIIYSTKQNMNNIENKIYKRLLFWNAIEIPFYLLLMFLSFLMLNGNQSLFDVFMIVNRIQGGSCLVYFYYLAVYLLFTTNNKRSWGPSLRRKWKGILTGSSCMSMIPLSLTGQRTR